MLRLLIVDDESTTRKGLRNRIDWPSLGIGEIAEASDGAEAIEAYEAEPADIVLTDVRMPRLDGIELAKWIRRRSSTCQIIFLSGYSEKKYLKSAIHLKAVDFVEKPVDVKELSAVIRQAVESILTESERTANEAHLKALRKRSVVLRRVDFLTRLLSEGTPAEVLESELAELELGVAPDDSFVVVVLKGKGRSGGDRIPSTDEADAQQSADQLLGECLVGYEGTLVAVIIDRYECFVVLSHQDRIGVQPSDSHCKSIREEATHFLDSRSTVSIGVGKVVGGITRIIDSYQSARVALAQEFYLGYGCIAFFKDSERGSYVLPERSEKEFLEHLDSADTVQARSLIAETTDAIFTGKYGNIDAIKNLYFRFFMHLYEHEQRMTTGTADRSGVAYTLPYSWEQINALATLDELRNLLVREIDRVAEHINLTKAKRTAVEKAIDYIDRNYMSGISVRQLADCVHLSHTYLCFAFKRATGKTINTYVEEVRIKNARRLLADHDLRLYEIADKVGYKDPNYFAKVFKKLTKCTPSSYRDLL